MADETSHWQRYHTRWAGLKAPLRPTAEVIDRVTDLVGNHTRQILLLGVTPELAQAFETVVAVDKSAAMIANIWPGNNATKTAIEADWLTLDPSLGRFSAIVGDGSCNAVSYPSELGRLFERVSDLLEPECPLVCRIYERPNALPPPSALVEETHGPARRNFHAFKWQLAMSIAEETEPSVSVELILETFNRLFPDRESLAARTGWPSVDIDSIDAYRNSSTIYCFPSRSELLALLPATLTNPRFHESGTYDLAECCPILSCCRT